MLGSLSLAARHPLLCGATGLAVVAAVSGGVALASAESSTATTVTVLSVDRTAVVTPVAAPVPDEIAGVRSAASAHRVELAAAAHRRELAAERAKVAAERREASARASRDLQRARIAATDPRTIAQGLVSARGWSDSEFSCLDKLWSKESRWQTDADNPSSSAYGIPQALPGSKMASAGDDWATSATTQITWGLDYIDDRYGTPCSAWSHSRTNNWY